jgi:hypothetical protein
MADLTQFGVPTQGSNNAMVMPKLQYRFRVNLLNFGFAAASTEITQNVISVTRPGLTHDEVTLDAYNSRAYLAGKHTWEPVTLTLRDDINGTVTKSVAGQLQKQLNQGTQMAPAAGADYKFGMTIEQLDGSQPGLVVESWSLNGCFIQNANYGENNYATSDVMQITLQIRFDGADIHNEAVASATTTGGLTNPGGLTTGTMANVF